MESNDLLKDVFADIMQKPASEQPLIGDPIVDSSPSIPTEDQVTSTGTEVSNATVQTETQDPSKTEEDQNDELTWDTYIEDAGTPAVKQSDVDFSSIGKAIGADLKSLEDLTKYVGELKTKTSELESKAIKPEELPPDLKDALEVWKNQGDYRAIFDVDAIDYSALDPIELFEDEVSDFFENADGTFREQEYLDYIDSITDTDKRLRGTQIQKQLIQEQAFQKQALKQKVEREKLENLRNLETAINRFEKLGDYSITPKVRQQVYQDLASGQFLDKLGINMSGAHKWEKLMEMYSKSLYFDAIQKFNADRVKNSTLRTEIERVGNHNLSGTPKLGNPTEQAKKSGIDLYFDAKGIKR